MKKLIVICLALLVVFLGIVSSADAAKKYPTKPIIMIVPYGAGGTTDGAARALAATLPKYLGQGIIVENKPGAGGQISRQYTQRAKADGYTMHMAAIGSAAMNPALNPNLPIKWDNFTFIAITQINPNIILVNSKSNIKTLKQLFNELKAAPGKLKFSSSGPGSIEFTATNILLKSIGLGQKGAIEVPFNSAAQSTAALLGGHVDFMQQNSPPVLPHISAGKLRPLAVTTPERLPYLPDVPTTAELGVPEDDIVGWRGVLGPPNLPDSVVKIWDEAIQKLYKDKAWLSILKKYGDEPKYMGPKETNAFIEKEFKRYRTLFTELGILVK